MKPFIARNRAIFMYTVLVLAIIGEPFGIFYTVSPPDPRLTPAWLIFWCLIQGIVSLFFLVRVFNLLRSRKWEEGIYFANVTIICIFMQVFGLFHTLVWFSVSAAITDTFCLFLLCQSKQIDKLTMHKRLYNGKS